MTQVRDTASPCIALSYFGSEAAQVTYRVTPISLIGLPSGIPPRPISRNLQVMLLPQRWYAGLCAPAGGPRQIPGSNAIRSPTKSPLLPNPQESPQTHPLAQPRLSETQSLLIERLATPEIPQFMPLFPQSKRAARQQGDPFYGRQFQRRQSHQNSLVQE